MMWWVPLAAAAISAYGQQQAAKTKAASQESLAQTQEKMDAQRREDEWKRKMAEMMAQQQAGRQQIPERDQAYYG